MPPQTGRHAHRITRSSAFITNTFDTHGILTGMHWGVEVSLEVCRRAGLTEADSSRRAGSGGRRRPQGCPCLVPRGLAAPSRLWRSMKLEYGTNQYGSAGDRQAGTPKRARYCSSDPTFDMRSRRGRRPGQYALEVRAGTISSLTGTRAGWHAS